MTTDEDVEEADVKCGAANVRVSYSLEESAVNRGSSFGENDQLLQKKSSTYGSVCTSSSNCCSMKEPAHYKAPVPKVPLGKHTRKISIGNAKLAQQKNWLRKDENLAALVNQLNREGASFCILGNEKQALAVFEVGDRIRDESHAVVASLKQRGIGVYMLTGDNFGAAQKVGRLVELEPKNVHACLLPEDKARYLSQIDGPVAMVGDGVNDALSMVKADVSIGMSSGNSKIALETADVALMKDNLNLVEQAVKIGRTVSGKLAFNLTVSILSKAVIVGITFTVYPSLWLAIAADVVTMLFVTLNSMTMLSR